MRLLLRTIRPQVATASLDCSVRVWDLKSGACAAILSGHTDKARTHPANSCYLIVNRAHCSHGDCTCVTRTSQAIAVAWSPRPEARLVLSGSLDSTARLWRLSAPAIVAAGLGESGRVTGGEIAYVLEARWDRLARMPLFAGTAADEQSNDPVR